MTSETKKTIKDLVIIFGSLGLFWAFAEFVPDGSIAKKIMAVLMVITLISSAIFLTALGNPIKKLYRKIRGIKD